jgi:hypothetical protein
MSGYKQGQQVVEALETYGWMIILVVAVIVILFSLGIFSPLSFISPSSTISGFTGLKITSVLANYTYIEFSVSNSLSVDANLNKFILEYNSTSISKIICEYLTLDPGQSSVCYAKLNLANTRDTVSLGLGFSINNNINLSSNGTMSFVPTNIYLVLPSTITSFSEEGLPSNTLWWTVYKGINHSSSGTSISFSTTYGIYSYTVGNLSASGCKYTALPSSGTLESGKVQNIIFVSSCAATFIEKELPTGTNWEVTYAGEKSSSTTNVIAFTNEKTGTYSFSVSKVILSGCVYSPSPSSGTLSVGNYQYIRFLGLCTTTFTETGLPSGHTWDVSYNSLAKSNSSPDSIVYTGAPGNFSYSVSSPPNSSSTVDCATTYTPSPSSGYANAGSTKNIAFSSLTTCKNTFEESNLPSGYTWSVTYNNIKNSTITPKNIMVTTSHNSASVNTYTATASVSGLDCTTPSESVEQGTTYDFSSWTCTTTFTETGLPSGTQWYVDFNGDNQSSTSATNVFTGGPGTSLSYTVYDVHVSNVDGLDCSEVFAPSPSSGTTNAGQPVTITYSYTEKCVTTFSETGLPPGYTWSVSYDGSSGSASTGSSISLSTGDCTVPAASVNAGTSYTFSGWTCTTTFSEGGLPSSYSWSVSYDGSSGSASTGSSISLSTGGGTFTATASVSGLDCTVPAASVNAGTSYTFSGWTCITTFSESSLPSGTSWSVTYDGSTDSSTSNSISFSTSSSEYSWSAPAVKATSNGCTATYTPNPSSGSLNAGSSLGIVFSPGICVPTNVITYLNLTVYNPGSTTPNPFQTSVNIDNTTYSSDIANNFQNVEFFYYNGSIIPSWLESKASTGNGQYQGKFWLKLASISGGGSETIYAGFASTSTNLFNGVNIGEAPQLSSTYAEYDDGANVFNYYQRFGGLSSLPSDWSSISGTGIAYDSDYIEISPASSTPGWYGIYMNPIPSSLSSTTTIWEFYGNMYDSVNAGSYVGTSTGTSGNFAGYSFSEGDSTTNLIYLGNGNTQFEDSTGYDDTNNNKIYSMDMSSSTSLNMLIDYTHIFSTTATSETPNYFDISPSNNGGSKPSTPIIIYWLRTRTSQSDDISSASYSNPGGIESSGSYYNYPRTTFSVSFPYSDSSAPSCSSYELSTSSDSTHLTGECNWPGGYLTIYYAGGNAGYFAFSLYGTSTGIEYAGGYSDDRCLDTSGGSAEITNLYIPAQTLYITGGSGAGGGSCGDAGIIIN